MTPYEIVQNLVDSKIAECNQMIAGFDTKNEQEGIMRLLVKRKYYDDLVNRCALLCLDGNGLTEDDLLELFGEDIYKAGRHMYEDMKGRWEKSLKVNMS